MIPKDPTAELPYFIDWSDWLEGGDTITTSTWTVPTGLTSASPQILNNVRAIITLKSGTVGDSYRVYNSIVTANGLKDKRFLDLYIEER